MQLKIKGSRWGLKKCTYLQGQKSVVSWLVNTEGDYREFLTRGVWCAGLLPPHSWVQLCFDLYVFSNTVCLLALSSLVCKFHAMSESYSLWDVSFTVDTCSLFSLCCTESQFFPCDQGCIPPARAHWPSHVCVCIPRASVVIRACTVEVPCSGQILFSPMVKL